MTKIWKHRDRNSPLTVNIAVTYRWKCATVMSYEFDMCNFARSCKFFCLSSPSEWTMNSESDDHLRVLMSRRGYILAPFVTVKQVTIYDVSGTSHWLAVILRILNIIFLKLFTLITQSVNLDANWRAYISCRKIRKLMLNQWSHSFKIIRLHLSIFEWIFFNTIAEVEV